MNDKKQIFGWAMYDWANSAFVTTVSVAVFPLFLSSVILPEGGFTILGRQFSATALLGFVSSFYALVIFLCAPVLGAISDFSASCWRKEPIMWNLFSNRRCLRPVS